MAKSSTQTSSELAENKIRRMEEELQRLKLRIYLPGKKQGIVNETMGLLGKEFPNGVEYQRKIRRESQKRQKRTSL